MIIDDGKANRKVLKRTDGKGVEHCVELVGTMKDSARILKPRQAMFGRKTK